MQVNWGPVVTAMVTPFNENLEVNLDAAQALAELLVQTGSTGLVVSGTTGESPTLSFEEKVTLFRKVKEAVGNRAAVIAGTGTYDTAESVQLSQEAERVGVDGLLLVAPYYNRPSQEGLYQHFKTVAHAVDIPVMIYNIPGRTGVNIDPSTLLRLAEVNNIVAVKEASGNLNQMSEICAGAPEGFLVYSGDDSLTLPLLAVGGVGVVSVASHIVGRDIRRMCDAFFAGHVQEAKKLHHRMLPLFKALFCTTNPVPVKAALNMLGANVGGVRLPLVEANEKEKETIRKALRDYGLLG
ncbi:MAG: 4-hydroxy-tetrahydrodipicolinate synthase [bacterium]|nr:4-hydroxy-tetrahydrodipicolinate synthase [bacterium]MCS7309543.1 4-hydroxy-tetrahydrodipicolinate synthase [Armatimonadota bacterium]MDW8104227.1 4-hydroxy-tetrahydrodipicolinate synthase [Armatimonadota bacterium]